MASTAAITKRYTPEQYLALERKAKFKSEYHNGFITAMAGASREHNLIARQLRTARSGHSSKARPCEVYMSDMRLRVTPTGLYTYPDVMAVCGEPQFYGRRGRHVAQPDDDRGGPVADRPNPTIVATSSSDYRDADLIEGVRAHLSGQSARGALHPTGERVGPDGIQEPGRCPSSWTSIGCEIALREIYAVHRVRWLRIDGRSSDEDGCSERRRSWHRPLP